MYKFWLVARHEYRTRVRRRSFVLGTLSMPLLLAAGLAIFLYVVGGMVDHRPIGYVDHSGLLDGATLPETNLQGKRLFLSVRPFPDEASAERALRDEEIQAYYVFPENYLENPLADLYYLKNPPDPWMIEAFEDYMRYNLLPERPTAEQLLVAKGFTLTVRSLDGNREIQDTGTGFFSMMAPFIMMVLMLFIIMNGAGYFLQVVTDEKENRTIEMMLTSVSPGQLIGGKSVALIAVGITQIATWVLSAVGALLIAQWKMPGVQAVTIPWDMLLVVALFFVPTYAIVAGMMIAIGAISSENQEAQQISGVVNLAFTFPVFFAALAFANPDSPLLIALSFWPTAAMITFLMRWGLTVVPWWQVALSWLLNAGTAVLVIWAAGRIFRVGMLRYGQRLSLNTVLAALRVK